MIKSTNHPSILKALIAPAETFTALAKSVPSPTTIFTRYTLWLLLLPPVFSWVGAFVFGWRLGAEQPVRFTTTTLTYISVAYFLVLVFGFVTTSLISRWMASTYGAKDSLGLHYALVTIVSAPLAVASLAHLFPHVFLNVLVLIPSIIWSMYLLYTGIPVVLTIPPERGMLMASALVAWLLVAAVSLLGLTMGLWVHNLGPPLAV
jgi:hypothetical protein